MKVFLKKIFATILFITFLSISFIYTDSIFLKHFFLSKYLEKYLSNQYAHIKIHDLKINFFSGKFSIGNLFIQNKYNNLAKISISDARLKISFCKNNFTKINCNINITNANLLPIQLNSFLETNELVTLENISIKANVSNNHIKGNIINNTDNTLYFNFTDKELSFYSQKFIYKNSELSGSCNISFFKDKIDLIRSTGCIKKSNVDALYIKNYLHKNSHANKLAKNLRFDVQDATWNIEYYFNPKKHTKNKLDINANFLCDLSNNTRKYENQHKILILLDNQIIKTNLIDIASSTSLINFTFDTKSKNIDGTFLFCGLIKDLVCEYTKKTKYWDLVNNFAHILYDKHVNKFSFSCNTENIKDSLYIQTCVPNFFTNHFQIVSSTHIIKNLYCSLKFQSQDYALLSLACENNILQSQIKLSYNQFPYQLQGSLTFNKPINLNNISIKSGQLTFLSQLFEADQKTQSVTNKIISQINLSDLDLTINKINLNKASHTTLLCTLDTIITDNKAQNQFKIIGTNHLDIEGNFMKINKDLYINFTEVKYGKHTKFSSNFLLAPKVFQCNLKGDTIDMSSFDFISLLRVIPYPKRSVDIRSKIKKIFMKNDICFNNFDLRFRLKNDQITSFFVDSQIDDNAYLKIAKQDYISDFNNSQFKLITNNCGDLFNAFGVKDVISSGKLNLDIAINQIQKITSINGNISIRSFHINNPPKLLNILSLPIFSSILTKNYKAFFYQLNGNFSLKNNSLSISNLSARGRSFSFSIKQGNFQDNIFTCKGFIVPSFIIPSLPFIPLPYQKKLQI